MGRIYALLDGLTITHVISGCARLHGHDHRRGRHLHVMMYTLAHACLVHVNMSAESKFWQLGKLYRYACPSEPLLWKQPCTRGAIRLQMLSQH